MSLGPCCFKGFQWEGRPEGKTIPFPTSSNQAYATGSNREAAVLIVHDVYGWAYPNTRLLADHVAKEAQVTVYVPDFFEGESLSSELLENHEYEKAGLWDFLAKNTRDRREPEILECARKLRSEYGKLGAVGYCYGGWAVFRLGAKGKGLVDCISTGHPSLLTTEDIDAVSVPVQVLAPEHDPVYTAELKEYTFKTLQTNGVTFDYQHFPGVEHACLIRGSPKVPREREAMARGKNAVVAWVQQYLHEQTS